MSEAHELPPLGYHRREWLNKPGTHCFSAIECFHGKRTKEQLMAGDDPEEYVTKFILHGCHNSVYLHDFTDGYEKLRTIAKMANDFADYLENVTNWRGEGMKIDDYAIGYQGNDEATCLVCGSDMDFVRPGKWQCQKCELDEMLQQARREGKAEGIRLGWEQCKREAVELAKYSHHPEGCFCDWCAVAYKAAAAIANMEYKHGN